ncbi:CAX interacting protein 4 [Euphorbia peplus]|nr:CAX interacting protein 4 [Euphorbia peplus]
MPATAGRVRMPANNRVHSSAALQTHGIWQSAIGYDPYAPNKEDAKASSQPRSANAEPEGENPYTSFQGLMELAKISSFNPDESRGACKRCHRVGHLPYQCRNFLSLKDDKEKGLDLLQVSAFSGLEKIKGSGKFNAAGVEESEDEEESETSDSEVDSDIERIIAQRNGKGKKKASKERLSRKKNVSDEDGSDSDSGGRKRGRSKKRRSKKRDSGDSESEDDAKRKRKRDKRRKRDESSSEEEEERQRHKRKSRKEKRRRRSHRHSDDSDTDASEDSGRRNRRKSRKAPILSDSGVSDSDDSRTGRGAKRTEKRGKKRQHEE